MSLPGLLRAGQDRGVPLNVRDPLLAFGPAITRWNRSHRGRPEGGPDPFRLVFCPGPRATPGGDNDVLVSATTATPAQSRTSFSASLGTAKDARKIGKSLFPVHRMRRSLPRRRRRFECCSSFVHCELAECDVQARLVSRSCGSFRPTRSAHRRPRHRTCHDGPPLRLPYASTSASPAFVDLRLFLNGASLAARRRTQRAVGRGSRSTGCRSSQPLAAHPRGRERPCCADREKGSEVVPPVVIVWPCRLRSMRTRRAVIWGPRARACQRLAGPPPAACSASAWCTVSPTGTPGPHPSPAAPPPVATGTCRNMNTECCRLMRGHRGR